MWQTGEYIIICCDSCISAQFSLVIALGLDLHSNSYSQNRAPLDKQSYRETYLYCKVGHSKWFTSGVISSYILMYASRSHTTNWITKTKTCYSWSYTNVIFVNINCSKLPCSGGGHRHTMPSLGCHCWHQWPIRHNQFIDLISIMYRFGIAVEDHLFLLKSIQLYGKSIADALYVLGFKANC